MAPAPSSDGQPSVRAPDRQTKEAEEDRSGNRGAGQQKCYDPVHVQPQQRVEHEKPNQKSGQKPDKMGGQVHGLLLCCFSRNVRGPRRTAHRVPERGARVLAWLLDLNSSGLGADQDHVGLDDVPAPVILLAYFIENLPMRSRLRETGQRARLTESSQ